MEDVEEQGKETEKSRSVKLEKEIKRVSIVEHNLRKYFKKRKHSYVAKANDSSCKVRDRIDPWGSLFLNIEVMITLTRLCWRSHVYEILFGICSTS